MYRFAGVVSAVVGQTGRADGAPYGVARAVQNLFEGVKRPESDFRTFHGGLTDAPLNR
jgi:hypothetical protein